LKFNRWTLIGYAVLFSMMTLWMQYKGKQAKAAREVFVADSLAKAAKVKPAKTTEAAMGPSTDSSIEPVQSDEAAAIGEIHDSSATDSASGVAAEARDSVVKVERKRITVKTRRYEMIFDNMGARIAGVTLDSLHGKPVHHEVLIDETRGGALNLSINQKDYGKVLWETDGSKSRYDLTSDSLVLTFSTRVRGGNLMRVYTIYADSPTVKHRAVVPVGVETWALSWNAGLSETETIPVGKGFGLMSSYFSELVFDNGTNAARETFEGKKSFNAESGVLRWVGVRRKYVAAVIDFGKETSNRIDAQGTLPEGKESGYPHDYQVKVSNGQWEDGALDFDFKILPLQYDNLRHYGRNYEQILFTGWESFFRADIWYVKLCGLVLHLLTFFHGLIPNWGIAIILLTLLVRFATLPLTLSQTRQMARMQQHQPELAKIKEKFKGDNQKIHLETMAYYKKIGISPFAPVLGCFPMLLQMPIFIALFNVLGRSVELKDAYFFGWIKDLSLPDVILPALKVNYVFPEGLTVLPFMMSITMYFQMKATIKDPNQRAMIWMMPIIMFVFSCSFPSGLVLYWSVSNLFTIAQTYVQMHNKSKGENGKAEKVKVVAGEIKAKPVIGTRKDAKKK
jgi:YidC/Oxa1 family membrane protein insertase